MNDVPLTADEREHALNVVADRIHRYRLETPAILFLEINRPLAGITGLAVHAVTPLFGAFTGLDTAERYASLLSDRDALDSLINRLDESRDSHTAQPKTRDSEPI